MPAVGAIPSKDDVAAYYRRFAPALYRRCLSLLRSPDDASEVVQDTFVRFWASAASFRGEAAPFTVLYRIATNAAIDRLRRAKHAPPSDGVGADAIAVHDPGFARVTSALDLARLTHGLSEDDLTIAVLYHIDGYTQDQVAVALAVSRPTVSKALARVVVHVHKRAARFADPRGRSDEP